MNKLFKIAVLSICTLNSNALFAKISLQIESGATYQTKNAVRIPGDTGTLFSLSEQSKGPKIPFRAEVKVQSGSHLFRALYAPLSISIDNKRLAEDVNFSGSTFNTATNVDALYKFNSYRLSYVYDFDLVGSWYLAAGITAKIRDAEIRLTQNGSSASKKNVGFVPLLRFEAVRFLSSDWSIALDVDGLAAPQGRAIDLGLFVRKQLFDFGAGHQATILAGYRTVEGGADNDEVYNFAWLHQATLGLLVNF